MRTTIAICLVCLVGCGEGEFTAREVADTAGAGGSAGAPSPLQAGDAGAGGRDAAGGRAPSSGAGGNGSAESGAGGLDAPGGRPPSSGAGGDAPTLGGSPAAAGDGGEGGAPATNPHRCYDTDEERAALCDGRYPCAGWICADGLECIAQGRDPGVLSYVEDPPCGLEPQMVDCVEQLAGLGC